MSDFVEILGYVRDISIVNRIAIVVVELQQPQILGTIEQVIFDSEEWQVTLVCVESSKRKIITMGVNHKLFRKLQMIVKMSEVLQININKINM